MISVWTSPQIPNGIIWNLNSGHAIDSPTHPLNKGLLLQFQANRWRPPPPLIVDEGNMGWVHKTNHRIIHMGIEYVFNNEFLRSGVDRSRAAEHLFAGKIRVVGDEDKDHPMMFVVDSAAP